MSTVLHELLAVEQSLAESANHVLKETTKTLSTKSSIFEGMSKAHEIFSEEQQYLVQPTEYKEVQSTVDEQLNFLNLALASYWDVTLQKEEANQRANADIIIGSTTIASNVPSIVLLGLEKKLSTLLATYTALPTLDAATTWELDPAYTKAGVYRTKYTTERQQAITTKEYIEASPATKEHKAQLVEQSKTEVIGKFIVTGFSGAISSFEKAKKLQKLTELIQAVKKARQRANNTEVKTDLTIAKSLLDYINS